MRFQLLPLVPLRAVALATLLLLAPGPASAQLPKLLLGDKAQKPDTSAGQDSTRVYPPAEIPTRAAATELRLREITSLATPRRSIVQIEQQLEAFLDTLQILSRLQHDMPLRQRTQRALADLGLEWQRREQQLLTGLGVLRERVTELDAARSELAGLHATWSRSVAAAERLQAPAQVLERSRHVLADLAQADTLVRNRQDALLGIEVRLSDASLVIEAGKVEVQQGIDLERRRLLEIDGPPLWKGLTQKLPSLSVTVRDRWRENLTAIGYFTTNYRARILLHLAATMLLFALVFGLRRGIIGQAREPASIPTDEAWLLANPVAATLLATLLSTLVFYPRAPLVIYDLMGMVAVIPLLRLIPTVLPGTLRRPAFGVALLYLLHGLTSLSLEGTAWGRIETLILEVATLTLVLLGLRRNGALALPRDGSARGRRLHVAAVVAAVMLVIGFMADLVGNTTLAHTLASATLGLSYLAVVLVACVRILDGLVSVALHLTASELEFVRRYSVAIHARTRQVIGIAAVAIWIWIGAGSLVISQSLRDGLAGLLAASLTIGQASISLGAVLLFFATIWIGTLLGRWISLILEVDVLDRLDLPRGVPVTIASLVRYALVAIAFFLALAATGAELGQLAIIGGALSVGVGFGLQTIVNNFISGLILAFERPVAVGDIVQVGTLTGQVKQIGIRASVIHTYEGSEVILPNGELVSSQVINWTRSDQTRRIEFPIGVAYGTDPQRVIELLGTVAGTILRVRSYPEPVVLFTGLGDSSLDFLIRAWTSVDDAVAVRSELAVAAYQALTEAGIEIPFPQRDLHLRSVDTGLIEQLRGPTGA
jgi:small-conductance mechanosensitive channel